jgi:hypothetical protein
MVDTNKTLQNEETSCVDFRMFAAKKEHSRAHTQSPKLENPAGDGALVGSTEDEHPENSTTGFVWPVARFAAKKEHSKF